ncbi:MAG: NAD(P)H-dependent oxidoreductase subunit E [Anaerolineaceae bacterium]
MVLAKLPAELQITLDTLTPQGRSALLPALHAFQVAYGYISEDNAALIGRALGVPLVDVYGVIHFYTLFHHQPVVKKIIHVCHDPACALAGADSIFKVISQRLEEPHPGTAGGIVLESAACLGLCSHAPAMLVEGQPRTASMTTGYEDLVSPKGESPHTRIEREAAILTANCGKGRPTSLEEYLSGGGYEGLRAGLRTQPSEVIERVKQSGLVGRGGAAFPTGTKWEGAANTPALARYVVCNGDEAEPGTFKDRVLMEDDPHRILEGILLAGFAIGAHKAYFYIRGEYEVPYKAVTAAIVDATASGFLGQNILGSGFDFIIEVRRGAGAYVCGEETALFESIEGKRGFPRVKPPFPTLAGLFGMPTVINNVETLCNVPFIIAQGAEKYRQIGTEKSPGSKLFCLSGDVVKPGLYEVPFGVTFRHLLYDLAGGVRDGRGMQAALFGGAAGAFASEADLDVPLTFEDLRTAGLPLGSGVITVMDDTRDLKDIILRLAHFFAEESCGKCFPCQIGTRRQLEIIQRVADGKPDPYDSERLKDLAMTMTDASLCGLGQTASSAVQSAMKLWPEYLKS